ncbi:tRNA lysidine(34) synthetase TilS [Parasaccharibacter sp. TMW 2.1886]|nr:tRNA lysidine(34) synthetase TilS [Parasaccharibacter sp. TMW 2.1886]
MVGTTELDKDGVRPVTPGEFSDIMSRIGPVGPDEAVHPLCIAVSGGGDSMALALLARGWRRHVLALVVDHALRPESAGEAALTCQRLAELDIPARQLTLAPLRPGGIQNRAREARFGVLESACIDAGGSVLLVAHHEADQEETLWMRQERGSGPRGLCGMAARTVRGRITLLRPLLGIRPERLKMTLRTAGVSWCEDPSNQNRRFRRVEVRQDLTDAGRRAMHVLRQGACARQKRVEDRLAALMACGVAWQPEGWLKLAPEILQLGGGEDHDTEPLLEDELLGRLIRLVGGQDYVPSRQAVVALRRAGKGSLGRVCLHPLRGRETGWMLYREARNLTEKRPARHGQCWDGRWRYLGPDHADAVVAALGPWQRAGRAVPACVLPALPALWVGGEPVAVPEGMRGLRPDLPRVTFVWDGGTPLTGERDWTG